MKKKHSNIPASYLVLLQENKILLLKRFNTGYEDNKYSFIAGHVDEGETFTQAIIREAYEEAGIKLIENDLKILHVMHRKSQDSERVDVFFTANKWDGSLDNKEPHKCSELNWFDVDNLPEDIIPYIQEVIKSIKNKTFYSEFGWQSFIE